MIPPKLGIGSYTYGWAVGVPGYPGLPQPLHVHELVRLAENLAVDVLQICDNLPLASMPAAELDQVRTDASRAGLALEIGTSGTNPDNLLRHLGIARRLAAKLVRTLLGSVTCVPDLEQAVADLRTVAPAFERGGVCIAVENYELYRAQDLRRILDQVCSPAVGACVDALNSLAILETPRIVLDALAPHAFCLHVKDFTITRVKHRLGYDVAGCPVGTGLFDVRGALDTLLSHGKLQSVILEQWTPFLGSVAESAATERRWAEQSVAYLRTFLPGRDRSQSKEL